MAKDNKKWSAILGATLAAYVSGNAMAAEVASSWIVAAADHHDKKADGKEGGCGKDGGCSGKEHSCKGKDHECKGKKKKAKAAKAEKAKEGKDEHHDEAHH